MSKSARPLLKSEIENAQSHTRSGAEAARFLGVDYATYKKYAKLYGIHERHINIAGKGVPKPKMQGNVYALSDILAGNHPTYDTRKLKFRLIDAGILTNECQLCHFNEARVLDGRVPLILTFKDGNMTNHRLENLELLCLNCAFLTVNNINNLHHRLTNAVGDVDDEEKPSNDVSMDDDIAAAIEEAKQELES